VALSTVVFDGCDILSDSPWQGKKTMGGWLETAGVILIVFAAAAAGRLFSRLRNPHWCWGYLASLALIGLLAVSAYVNSKTYIPVFAWLAVGRVRFVIIGFAVTLGTMTLLTRLKRPIEQVVLLAVMMFVVIWSSVMPFFLPALIKNDLSRLPTLLDADNVCVQSTDYTCGPAAAVSALQQLGLSAHEGELAVLSHTSPFVGTLPWCLYTAIKERYASQGLECRFRHFDSIGQLREADVTLAVVRDAFLLDHCVAVLEVDDDTVTIADPVLGLTRMSHKNFEGVWRFYGITLKSGPAHKG
jgi:hypothetical protein